MKRQILTLLQLKIQTNFYNKNALAKKAFFQDFYQDPNEDLEDLSTFQKMKGSFNTGITKFNELSPIGESCWLCNKPCTWRS